MAKRKAVTADVDGFLIYHDASLHSHASHYGFRFSWDDDEGGWDIPVMVDSLEILGDYLIDQIDDGVAALNRAEREANRERKAERDDRAGW